MSKPVAGSGLGRATCAMFAKKTALQPATICVALLLPGYLSFTKTTCQEKDSSSAGYFFHRALAEMLAFLVCKRIEKRSSHDLSTGSPPSGMLGRFSRARHCPGGKKTKRRVKPLRFVEATKAEKWACEGGYMAFSRLIRSSMGGWVLKRLARFFPRKGLTMNMWAVDWSPLRMGIFLL